MISRGLKVATALLLAAVVGMGLYLRSLRSREREQAQVTPDTRPIPAPVVGPAERVTLYVADDEAGVLRKEETTIALPPEPAQRAREVLHALLGRYVGRPSPHPIAQAADVKDVFLIGGGTAVVDATAPFADGHPSGVFVETLTLASLVKTLNANVSGITRVKILVDGQERETLAGHVDLRSFYDVTAVEELGQELH
jgi:hypothetical protein